MAAGDARSGLAALDALGWVHEDGADYLERAADGYACNAGIIYYRGTKQRVRLELTPELEAWVIARIAVALVIESR